MDFSSLKRQTNFDSLKKKIESITQPTEQKDDDRFWYPTVDKAGNGMAVIRFLPTPAEDGEDGLPWVRVFNHGFQGPGGWLIDGCLTTIGQPCYVCEKNSEFWGTGIETNKDIARKQKRKLTYISNVYIISDPNNPENNGTVKLFKYGKKIFDKINEAMNPQFEDETPINPFDFWQGANFKLKMRNVEGYRNYDKSEFESSSPLFDDDSEMEKIWKQEYSIKEFINPDNFSSYDKLKARYDKITGAKSVSQPRESVKKESYDTFDQSNSGSDEEEMDYFRSLAKTGDDVPF